MIKKYNLIRIKCGHWRSKGAQYTADGVKIDVANPRNPHCIATQLSTFLPFSSYESDSVISLTFPRRASKEKAFRVIRRATSSGCFARITPLNSKRVQF